jgi:hypothetical protein
MYQKNRLIVSCLIKIVHTDKKKKKNETHPIKTNIFFVSLRIESKIIRCIYVYIYIYTS